MANAEAIRRRAAVKLKQYGQVMYLREKTRTFDGSGNIVASNAWEQTVYGIVEDYEARLIDGKTITVRDRKVLIADYDLGGEEPHPGHMLSVGGQEREVIHAMATAGVNGTNVLWELQVRF